jgi:hypothetical protein
MLSLRRFRFAIGVVILMACQDSKNEIKVVINNSLDIERREIVSIPLDKLAGQSQSSKWQVASGDEILKSQVIDNNADLVIDELIFLITVGAGKELNVVISQTKEEKTFGDSVTTFSRFVPERTDDYAWENDLVAFRTYGPEAQRLVTQNEKGGTLSSGLDCWLKRVNYSIIDKWYQKYTSGGTYHQDDGEGYDPYHVGKSRGCGGVGVWKDDSLYVSKNFVSYRKIAEGPLRNIFELTYAPWQADETIIHETKRITIDLGEQLYRVEEILAAEKVFPNLTIGITLHEKAGKVSVDSTEGVFSYWETINDSDLGTAVVINPDDVITHNDYRTSKKDLSHLYVIAKPKSELTYFTGYAWKKAGKIQNAVQWNDYLKTFSRRLRSPLTVTINEN